MRRWRESGVSVGNEVVDDERRRRFFLGVELLDDTTSSFTWIQPMKFNHVMIHVRSMWSCWVLIRCFAFLQFRFLCFPSRVRVCLFSKCEKAKKSHWIRCGLSPHWKFWDSTKVKPFNYLYIHSRTFINNRDNYILPTCSLPLILSAYLWFKFWHFTHLWLSPSMCRVLTFPSPLL